MIKRIIQLMHLVFVKIKWLIFGDSKNQQIELFLPKDKTIKLENFKLFEGYELRTYVNEDFAELQKLYSGVGFEGMTTEMLKGIIHLSVPQGIFVINHKVSNDIVGAFMARHMSDDEHPEGGRIDWLAVDLKHRGRNIGLILTVAATHRLKSIGYKNIYVTTDDYRLSAIKTFLNTGFVPNISSSAMEERWSKIYKLLNLSFLPDEWVKLKEY